MKNSSIHTSWLAWFTASILLTVLLWSTGYLDFLISKDSIGIAFSLLLVLTLLNAAWSQYKSFKSANKVQNAMYNLNKHLKTASSYHEALAGLILHDAKKLFPGTSIDMFFENLYEFIQKNKEAPLSESNIETCEMIVDEMFHIETSDEVEQAQNLSILGMLGTFLGILYGFASIDWAHVTPDNAFAIVTGVMSGISIALITSVLGIIFSVFLKKMHKRLSAKHRSAFVIFSKDVQGMSRILCHQNTYNQLVDSIWEVPK